MGILKSWAPGIMFGAMIAVFVAAKLPSNTLTIIFGILGFFLEFIWQLVEVTGTSRIKCPRE